MKKLIQTILTLISLNSFGLLQAQVAPAIQWQKSFGGSSTDIAYSIQQTADGGFIVGGGTPSNNGDVTGNHGLTDCWILRLDSSGNLIWQKTLGGSDDDIAYSIQQTADGGFIFAGISYSNNGDVSGHHDSFVFSDYWVVKLDASGNLIWQKSLGGIEDDNAYSVHQTTDGGFIVAGFSGSSDGDVSGNHGGWDYWITKLDTAGNLVWQKSLGGSWNDLAYSVQETIDGGFIIGGVTGSSDGDISENHGGFDYWIIKLDSNSNIVWQKSLGGSSDESAQSVEQIADGGFIVAGYSNSTDQDVSGNHGNDDYWVTKLDMNGNLIWQKSLGGSSLDWAWPIQQTNDNGFIVAGNSQSLDGDVSGNHGSSDFWIVKLDTGGNIIWTKSLGGVGYDKAYSIEQTNDDGFIIAGYSNSNDGDVSGNHGGADFWIVKLSCDQLQLFYADADSDSFGNASDTLLACTMPPGYVTNNLDCNDANPDVHPGVMEIPGNGIDDDCDGLIDEICSANFTLYPDSLIPHHYWAVNLATGYLPLTYFWSWGDSTYDTIAYPSHTYAAAGFYNIGLTIQDSTGCQSNFSNIYDIQKQTEENTIITVDVVDSLPGIPTAIQNANVLQSWSVFPNPTSTNVFVNYSLSIPATVNIEVYDVLGNKLDQLINDDQERGQHTTTIDARKFSNGIYFLQINALYQVASQKIIVTR
jgi:hypothetical protein